MKVSLGLATVSMIITLVMLCANRSPAPLVYTPGEGWTYETYGGGGKWRKEQAKEQLAVSQEAFDNQDYSLAEKSSNYLLKKWPLSDYAPSAQYLLARCLETDGNDEKAFKAYQKMFLTYPKSDTFVGVKPETYGHMIKRFSEATFSGMVTVTGSEDVTKGGLNFFDEEFCLTRVVEKPSDKELLELRNHGLLRAGQIAWYNAGIYIFKPSLFEFTAKLEKSPRGEYELTDAISALIDTKHTLAGLQIQGRWVDVRDPEVLEALDRGQNAGS
jgi:tetratricopeptide (TPR) repeat protein